MMTVFSDDIEVLESITVGMHSIDSLNIRDIKVEFSKQIAGIFHLKITQRIIEHQNL